MRLVKIEKYEPVEWCCTKMHDEMKIKRVRIEKSDSVYHAPCFVGVLGDDPIGWVIFEYCPFCGEQIHK